MVKFLTPLAASLPPTVPFTGPETLERRRGAPFLARLGANESLFGPSPKALAAMQTASHEVWKYGDPEGFALRSAIAAHHGAALENVVVGEGIDGLLGYLCRLTVAPGVAVVTSDGAYPTFNFHVAGYGGTLQKIPYNGDHEDPDALLSKAEQVGATLIYLSNPDNPMGSHHPAKTLEAMAAKLPPETLLVLDEAYIDLAPPGTVPHIPVDHPQVIRLRTFSKGYGMAGLRVGYALGAAPLIAAFDRVRNHFALGPIAQAGALAALADQDWLTSVRGKIDSAREGFGAVARENGLIPLPSATNFLTLDCGRDGDHARALLASLTARGIFARMPFVAPQDRCIRISLGGAEALAIFARTLPLALADLG